jgi:hypothetical protein
MAIVVFFAFTKMPLRGHIHLIVTAAKARTNLPQARHPTRREDNRDGKGKMGQRERERSHFPATSKSMARAKQAGENI